MNEPTNVDPRLARVAPTWEVELLISGVAIFAMLQLPGWLDDGMFALEPRLGRDWRMIAVLAYFYSKSAAIVLACTFALHLLLRAQWIALMGVHSVFPRGIHFDDARMGPIQREIETKQTGNTEDAIERADNRASVVFAIGVSVALIIAMVCIVFCSTLLVATLLTNLIGLQVETFVVVGGLFMLLMLPYLLAIGVDQHLKERIRPGTPAHRLIAKVIGLYTRFGMGRRSNHILATLLSNQGEKRTMMLVFGIMLLAISSVSFTYVAMQSSNPIGSYGLFPSARALAIDAAHYDDQRDATRDQAVPYIDSMVVEGPYLHLTVPYEPRRDGPALRSCKQPAQGKAVEQAQALLACLQSTRTVLLDGKPVEDLRYEIASDPRTDRPALLAMMDVRALAPGRHELLVGRPLVQDSRRDGKDPTYRHYRIVFWR
ncbi:hypothetical protein [Thermomonas carbonis]|uniref:Uncharacterized protein n=1 Tax=Thermomonas carbonis TaxID=1463158 RepID=A0A7G9SPB6_9GAMM|nr:hypothetical protein [Thermomonas carbonis]QNN69691.1 hypothetical protein H9L16_13665 [Thermomonas carbonis]GHB94851.1 hypothetical protein GCM10010080_02660 [Thermomonas carbonis]